MYVKCAVRYIVFNGRDTYLFLAKLNVFFLNLHIQNYRTGSTSTYLRKISLADPGEGCRCQGCVFHLAFFMQFSGGNLAK